MDTERNKEYRNLLESKGRDELRIIAKRLKVAGFSKLSKNGLITAILDADPTGKAIKPITWWNRYHNHVYGIASLVGLALAVIFFILQNSQHKLPSLQDHLPSASLQSPATSDNSADSNNQVISGKASATPPSDPKPEETASLTGASNANTANSTTSSTNKSSSEGVAANPPTSPEAQYVPTEADHTELEIVGYDGKSTFLYDPSIAYPSTFGPSRITEGIAVRRGVEQSTLLWSRIRTLRFRSRQEKNEKGTAVWRHDVSATLTNGKVMDVEIVNDWNMAYMGGGGTGLLFGQSDLGETKIPFSKISMLKVLKYAQSTKK
jgi:hypothetical protein